MVKVINIIIEVNFHLKMYKENCSFLNELNHIKGIGKEYYIDGTIIFEGEYLNGIRNGRGKEYFLVET